MIKEEIYFMKRQIRRGVFETNSSSTHSITMCMKSDYDRWSNGEGFSIQEVILDTQIIKHHRKDIFIPKMK